MSHLPLHKHQVTAVNVNTMDPIILLIILTQALIEMTSSSQGILKIFIVIYKVQEVLKCSSVCPSKAVFLESFHQAVFKS